MPKRRALPAEYAQAKRSGLVRVFPVVGVGALPIARYPRLTGLSRIAVSFVNLSPRLTRSGPCTMIMIPQE